MLPGLPRTTSFRFNPIIVGFVHISSSWVEIRLHTKFQLPRLRRGRTVSFMHNPNLGGRGQVTLLFLLIFFLVELK